MFRYFFQTMPGRNAWVQKDLEDALRCIREKGMKIQTASKRFKIPRRTIRDYLDKKVSVKGK